MLLWQEKTLALFSLLAATLLSICLAYKLRHLTGSLGNKTQIAINGLHCFGGGVFLGVLLLHLLPEVRSLAVLADMEPGGYPVAELFTSAGFFLILLIDQSVTSCTSGHPPTNKQLSQGTPEKEESSNEGLDGNMRAYGSIRQSQALLDSSQKDLGKKTHLTIFIFALSTHSIFEGLAMGLQPSSVDLWTLFAAVITHRFPISFSLGLYITAIYENNWRAFLAAAAIFAVMSPVGVAIGTVIVNSGSKSESDSGLMVTMVILQGLASGTFLYVAFFEILVPNIRSGRGLKLVNFLSVFAGFVVMALVRLMHVEQGGSMIMKTPEDGHLTGM